MGGIVITVKTSEYGPRYWSGHAEDVMNFFKKKNLSSFSPPMKGDDHNGNIIIDAERRTIIFDTDYFKLDQDTIRFWKLLGFDVLGRLKGD